MKKGLLLVFACAFIAEAFAQITPSFPREKAVWNYRYFIGMNNPTNDYDGYFMEGDTTIGGEVYSKLHGLSMHEYLGAVRDTGRKVYYLPEGASGEILVMDFNVQLNDTVHIAITTGDTIMYAVTVDSGVYFGAYRKHVTLQSTSSIYKKDWIEGVGTTGGFSTLPDAYTASLSHGYHLMCFETSTSSLSYPDWISGCFLDVEESPDFVPVSVYPNPASQIVTVLIPGEEEEKTDVSIYDLSGIKVMQCSKTTIDIRSLPAAVYILKVSKNEHVYTSRLIKL